MTCMNTYRPNKALREICLFGDKNTWLRPFNSVGDSKLQKYDWSYVYPLRTNPT